MEFQLVNGKIQEVDNVTPHVTFYEHVKQIGKCEYVPVDYIRIKYAGNRDFISRKATKDDIAAHPKEWAEYQAGIAGQDEGVTPLNALPLFKMAFGLELASQDIHTVEELAAMPEPPFPAVGPLWKQAKKWVALNDSEVA
jgi:hypothetical protein